MPNSQMLKVLYKDWQATATPADLEFVDQVYEMCDRNYGAGGDLIIECYGPKDVLDEFKTLDDVRRVCGLHVEQALNARWGEDSDPELRRARTEWR